MEVIIFCITITTLAVFSIFGLGIAIGRECGKHERNAEKHSGESSECGHYYHSILCSGSSDMCDSTMGDVHGQINSRCPMGMVRELKNKELADILKVMTKILGLSPGERDVLEEAAYRLTEGLNGERIKRFL